VGFNRRVFENLEIMKILRTVLFCCALLLLLLSTKSQNTDDVIYEDNGKYLMITPPEFESALDTFARYKKSIGFDVEVVNTNITGKTQVSIKNYIQTLYDDASTRPKFVLLVGDVEFIPAFQGNPSGKVKKDPITDLGYALLAGDDYFADIFLGRFPVSNAVQLKNIIDKTIFMEMNMHRFDKKAVLIAGDEKKGIWNRTYMRNSFKKVNKNIVKQGFISMEYDYQILDQPDKKEVMHVFSENPLFFIYSGHGSFTSLAGKTFELENRDILVAQNTVFPIVFAFSCKTGNYAQTCIGKHFIKAKAKGAVAYFGSSVNTQTNSDPILAKKIFGKPIPKETPYLSAIINLGMKQYYKALGVSKKKKEVYIKAFNLLGDPSFNVIGG
jgi:hypothetical protein